MRCSRTSLVENVAFSLKMKGVDKAERPPKAIDMLQLMHMEAYAARLPRSSPAASSSVSLWRAHLSPIPSAAADEPLSALDPFLHTKVRAELKKLQRSLASPSCMSRTARKRRWRWPI